MVNSATDPAAAAKLDDYVAKLPTVRIINKAAPNYSLAIRNGKLTLAPTSPSDATQRWAKVDRTSKSRKDDQGFPVFHLVNKETGQAMKHSVDAHLPVQLTPFKPPLCDSTLWSQTSSTDTYKAIRKANNTTLNLDAFGGNTRVYEGMDVVLWGWNGGVNQLWSIVPYSSAPALPPVRVVAQAAPDFSLAIRNGKVTLARNNPSDPLQRWVKYDKWSKPMTDVYGIPAFALINISTGQALKHDVDAHKPVQLTTFDPERIDESTLWTREGPSPTFNAIRKAKDTKLILDAFGANTDVYEGITIGLWEWNEGANQLWSIVTS